MYTNSIFMFGSERESDAISSLPLELSWKIFSYLDDASLRSADRVISTWRWIISSKKKLKRRLNMYELGLRLGSRRSRLYKDNKRILKHAKIAKSTTYLPVYQDMANADREKIYKSKRGGDLLVICAKRFKLR